MRGRNDQLSDAGYWVANAPFRSRRDTKAAFDVRTAKRGRKLVLLDGQEISAACADTLVIRPRNALAMAGIMGASIVESAEEALRTCSSKAPFSDLCGYAGKARGLQPCTPIPRTL